MFLEDRRTGSGPLTLTVADDRVSVQLGDGMGVGQTWLKRALLLSRRWVGGTKGCGG